MGLKCSERETLLALSVCSIVYIRGDLGNSLLLRCGHCVLNMEKEIEDLITGNRWKQAYEVSVSDHCLISWLQL